MSSFIGLMVTVLERTSNSYVTGAAQLAETGDALLRSKSHAPYATLRSSILSNM
jgi:hypothetical protein